MEKMTAMKMKGLTALMLFSAAAAFWLAGCRQGEVTVSRADSVPEEASSAAAELPEPEPAEAEEPLGTYNAKYYIEDGERVPVGEILNRDEFTYAMTFHEDGSCELILDESVRSYEWNDGSITMDGTGIMTYTLTDNILTVDNLGVVVEFEKEQSKPAL